MKTGDPKVARLLIVVAIGAVGFVVIQLLPAKNQGGPTAVRPVEQESALAVKAGLTSNVPNDCFSSPMLARIGASTRAEGETDSTRPMAPGSLGILPSLGVGPFAANDEATGAKKQLKDETPKPPPPKRTATLSGIVTADSPVAFIAIDGKDSRGCRVGELVAPGVRLVAIDGSEAILGVGGRRKTLELGQVTEL